MAGPRPPRKVPSTVEQRRLHWEAIHHSHSEEELSWWEAEPSISLRLITRYARPESRILDAGGGSSPLASRLHERGFQHLTVADISGEALRRARSHAPHSAAKIRWLRRDLTRPGPLGRFDLWHDRAVFHFLVLPEDRAAYRQNVERSLVPGGVAIIATFTSHGPTTCSGLPVQRYSALTLGRTWGPAFTLEASRQERHVTPWGTIQPFVYAVLRRVAG